jgi:hypothetical protein
MKSGGIYLRSLRLRVELQQNLGFPLSPCRAPHSYNVLCSIKVLLLTEKYSMASHFEITTKRKTNQNLQDKMSLSMLLPAEIVKSETNAYIYILLTLLL